MDILIPIMASSALWLMPIGLPKKLMALVQTGENTGTTD